MSQKGRMLQAVAMGVVIAAAIIGGVTLTQQNFFSSISTESNTLPSNNTGTLSAQLTDPPNVPDGVSHVYVDYSDVQVHASGIANDSGWFTIANSGSIDLMSIINVSVTLGSALVSTGLFTLVKFDISSASITYSGQNYTALVPNNQISVPITNGGVYVNENGSSGFLIDISPTVVPFQNGTQIGFVLVPSADSLPISSHVWQKDLEQPGSKIDNTWLHTSQVSQVENITIEHAQLGTAMFQVSVKNTGNVNTKLTSIYVIASGTSGSQQQMHMSGVGTSQAVFQILSNGTLILPLGSESATGEDYSGYMLSAGQTVTLSYSGPIITLSSDSAEGAGQGILPGMYQVKVTTGFGTSTSVLVNSTSS